MDLTFKKIYLKIHEYMELIKFEHTIFALPFALSGMLLANLNEWPSLSSFLWVILAMVGGRTAAMGLNRVIDTNIDKKNPRTKDRAIPAGRVRKISVIILAVVSFGIMIYATWHLPIICRKLLPAAIAILIFYSYTKRFSHLSHLVLGAALGAAAAGGWLAVSGVISIYAILWGLAVVFWVGGFDIIYAVQDIDFDRANGLFSIPAKLGIKKGLVVSKLFHIITVIMLIILGLIYYVKIYYWIGIMFVGCMLIYEHFLLRENDLSKINTAFFNINGYVSIGLLFFIVLDKIL